MRNSSNRYENLALVISLEKMLLSRDFSLKSMRENSRNFHTLTLYCENCEILLPPFRRKNSVKSTLSLKNFTPNYYDGKYFAWRVNFTFLHNVQCNGGFSTLPNFVQNSIFPWNRFVCIMFVMSWLKRIILSVLCSLNTYCAILKILDK